MAKINFGGVQEEVIMRKEFPMKKALKTLKNETIAVIGYGVQGRPNRSTCGITVSTSSWARQSPSRETGNARSATAGCRARPCSISRRPYSAARSSNTSYQTPLKSAVAQGQEEPQSRRCTLFLARILDCIPRPDESHSAQER